jgi:hypothetical protein
MGLICVILSIVLLHVTGSVLLGNAPISEPRSEWEHLGNASRSVLLKIGSMLPATMGSVALLEQGAHSLDAPWMLPRPSLYTPQALPRHIEPSNA